jgi:4-hydroxybenzoyl-CoA thioesterase
VIVYERKVRFEEVDAAGIVFFARYLHYAHEAMEAFFAGLDGGYARLIVERGVGFPAVQAHVGYAKPVRYGDALRIEVETKRLGTRSATLLYRMFRASDGELAAEVEHVVVTSDLGRMKSVDMPDDVRAVFEAHLIAEPASLPAS